MRNTIVGIIVGLVVGVVIGATVIAPGLPMTEKAAADKKLAAPEPTAEGTGNTPPSSVLETPPEPDQRAAKSSLPSFLPIDGAPIRWRVTGPFSSRMPETGILIKGLERRIIQATAGRVEAHYHEPGALVAVPDMPDAVSSGVVEGIFSSPEDWEGKSKAFLLFSGIPFGPDASEYLAWMESGDGGKLLSELAETQDVHAIVCGVMAAEASGWFRNEITSLSELDGLTMRASGLGGAVLRRLGVDVRELSGGSILSALESGEIQALTFSTPAVDQAFGFHRLAQHYYFPGWHRPSSLLLLMINKTAWNQLQQGAQAAIKAACGETVRTSLSHGANTQIKALKRLQAEGAILHRWPPGMIDDFARAWREEAIDLAANDPMFEKIWNSLQAFRKRYALWRELGQPPIRQ
ncbi:MAG: TRAP transporter substrate-binding protein [Rhodospirillales bacterium]|nr:TRAP transporter substrate-binding protein [Rhodospirillales bacterium]MCW9001397.1 TRAP transporter substrate-binding protein [Rhodospirillales bacterium]